MAIHPKLESSSNAKYVKKFSKYLYSIEKDLATVGCSDFDVDIESLGNISKIKTLLGLNWDYFDKSKEQLIISTKVHGCQVEILIPIAHSGYPLPYLIRIEIQESMAGRAEYRLRRLSGKRGKWHYEPTDRRRSKDIKRLMPKMDLLHWSGGVFFSIKTGSILEAISDDHTRWEVISAYERGFLRSGDRPSIKKYLEAIPAVENLLRKWDD